ncbi:DUF2399 domain-containing protein [Achromobacter insuavis]|uniref:DUF2399 domain-containing protein n=1 Tax=Achromobacter insuavis TaxID=1287735 RepID=UPI003D66385C
MAPISHRSLHQEPPILPTPTTKHPERPSRFVNIRRGVIRIANLVTREHGASAWRMNEKDYNAAAERSQGRGTGLSGAAAVASWDPALSTEMAVLGLGIAEEAVAESLLSDLRRS